jgi:hypothetical protein
MTRQPEALRLADLIDKNLAGASDAEIANELRRLHEINRQLLEAAKLVEVMLRGAALNANKATEKLLRAIEKAEAV